jgi:hypothetical protein
MSERRGEHRGERVVPIAAAAVILGISKDAVRMRVKRGTLRSEKRDDRVYVHLNDVPDADPNTDPNVLAESLQDQVTYLRSQLDAERKANDENRRLLAGLIERMPALEAGAEPSPSQASEAGAQEPAEAAPMPAPAQADTGAQSRPERVGWWRRLIGG